MRVLVLADAEAFHTERYVPELQRQNCEVLLASLENGDMPHHQLKRRSPIGAMHYILSATEIRALIKAFKPDIINPHFASGYGFAAALASSGTDVPILLHLWGSDILVVPKKSWLHRRKTGYALANATRVTADSDHLIDSARQIYPDFSCLKVPWGIERQYLSLHKTDYTFNKPLRVIVPRRHEAIYNNMFILRALAPLLESGEIRLTIPNFGTLLDDFKRNARSMLASENISYYDMMSRSDFLAFMAEHDAYLSSARSDSSPASLIEAMAFGLVPITADIPGIREWMVDGAGFLYEPYTGESLRRTIKRLVTDDDPLVEMRQRNRARVEQEAVFEQNVARTIEQMRLSCGES